MKNAFIKFYNFCCSWPGTIAIVLFVIMFVAQAFVIPSGSMKNTLLVGDFLFAKKWVYGIPTPRIPWFEVPILPDFKGNGHLIEGKRPERGEIVVFRNPENTKVHYVKRMFAKGGDEVIFTPDAFYLRPVEGDKFIAENYDASEIVTLMGEKFIKEPYKNKGIRYEENRGFKASILAHYSGKFAMSPVNVSELPKFSIDGQNIEFNAFYKKIPDGEFFMIGDNRDNSNDSRFWGSVPYSLIVGTPWFVYFSMDSKREIRWERVGRFVDTLENNEKFIKEQD